MLGPNAHVGAWLSLTRAITEARGLDDIYAAALDALGTALAVDRAAILLFGADGVMRFQASRGLSDAYMRAVEGHSPWSPESRDPRPLVVSDVTADPSLAPYRAALMAEGIRAVAFIPLVSMNRVVGKFMLYYPQPRAVDEDELQWAAVFAAQLAFALERRGAEEQARRNEERLRFALDAASMGTWDWDLLSNTVRWSENLERIHGLPPGTFDGTFESYEREIHPEDRERVLASARRAVEHGVPHEVEYRLVAPDGTVRWCEGKGRVEYQDGRPVRMTGVCVMVTRRKEAELARLAAAEEASRLKDDFLATLSHELRTPMNAILGWSQMLRQGGLSEATTRQAIEVIARNAALQGQLIEDILDVSRIITGKLEIERAPVFLPELLDAAIAGLTPALAAKQLELVTDVDRAVAPIEGDTRRLHQVIGNILSNAIKFSGEGGRIVLTCRPGAGGVHLTVADSGIGIEPAFLPYVFDRFRQADSRSTREHGGLGLGLAIARHLVALHGGTIHASSEGTGKGTTISLTLPAVAAPADDSRSARLATL